LFHPDPGRFFTGAAVKIGYFASESDLRYHDEIEGDLFTQVSKTMDLLLTKYLKASISYEGIQRVESFPMPESALREAVLNAVVHRDYGVPAPIQIRVNEDRLRIWNPGELPDDWAEADLLKPHASQPYNPDIANAFFRAGEIEAGRGIQRIFDACNQAGTPEPRLEVRGREFWFEFPIRQEQRDQPGGLDEKLDERLDERLDEKLSERRAAIIRLMRSNPRITVTEIGERLGISRTAADKNIQVLKSKGWVQREGGAKGGRWRILEGAFL
jgi:ATP-dependent DNA helicase RecG